MELRHLRYFLTVAEEGQMTRAAERLAMQQPPLSQQIRALEDELGFPLFVRVPRGVVLTEAGKALARDAERVIAQLAQGVTHARRIAAGDWGAIAVGLTSSAAFHPFSAQAIRQFGASHPSVSIDLIELNAAEIIERMLSAELQIAFLRKPVETPSELDFVQVLEEPMVVALPVSHPLLEGYPDHNDNDAPTLHLRDLANDPFILVRRPGAPGMYADILSACALEGWIPKTVREVPRMLTGIHMVAAGLGITIVPASMQSYRHAHVRYCPIHPSAGLSAPLHIGSPRDIRHNPAAERFIAFVRSLDGNGTCSS